MSRLRHKLDERIGPGLIKTIGVAATRLSMPRSTAAQLAGLLVLALLAAQVPPSVIFAYQTSAVGQAAFQKRGDRAVILARLLNAITPDAVPGVIASFEDRDYHFSIDGRSAIAEGGMTEDQVTYAHFLAHRFPAADGPVRTQLGIRDPGEPAANALPNVLRVSVRLVDGRWLNGETHFVRRMAFWLQNTLAHVVASIAAISGNGLARPAPDRRAGDSPGGGRRASRPRRGGFGAARARPPASCAP